MPLLEPKHYPYRISNLNGSEHLTLWYEGDPTLLQKPLVAIVGTRNISAEGVQNTRRLGTMLTNVGCVVVSGMAKGVDRAAHESAMDAGGFTIAVMGTPIEGCYPRDHSELKAQIQEHGLVLSQFQPFSKTHRSNFPRRNELMALLCRVTFIVEASIDSGTKHQVKAALRYGHKVGFLRSLVEMQFPWVSEAIEMGSGVCIENKHDVLRLLTEAGLYVPCIVTDPDTTPQTGDIKLNAAAIQAELAFEFPAKSTPPKRKRAKRKAKPMKSNVPTQVLPLMTGFDEIAGEIKAAEQGA